jgi:hypothetical protein
MSRIEVPSNPFRANSSEAAAMIWRRRSGPRRKDFGFFLAVLLSAGVFLATLFLAFLLALECPTVFVIPSRPSMMKKPGCGC